MTRSTTSATAGSRLRRAVAGVAAIVAMSATACSVGTGTAADSPASPPSASASRPPSQSPTSSPSPTRRQPPPHRAAPTPSPTPATPVAAGRSAWVSVAVARLWESPASPRPVDAPALTAPVHFRAWLDSMTLSDRYDLSSYSDTEALMGERVVVRRVADGWADVVVPDQPSQKDAGGYPGWVPVRQLTAVAPPRTGLVATVVRPTTWLLHDRTAAARTVEISSGTSLPVLGRVPGFTRVRLPAGPVRRIASGDVVVHRRGTPALPPHDGVLATAKNYLGLDYLWGGLSGFGIDCSGLTWLSNRLHGTLIPRDALPQSQGGTPVSEPDLVPGDLIFYATNGLVHHVTMYAGSGQMIEAPHTGSVARVVPVRSVEYYGARRY